MSRIDPKAFWEAKIREWEVGRYEDIAAGSNALEGIANRASDSLRNRIQLAGTALAPIVKGKRVIEIGCGSGILAQPLLDAGATHYTGYDIAEIAISSAAERHVKLIKGGQAEFHAQSIDQMPELEADVVFSLGLLDWLQDEEIAMLFAKSGNAAYLHAIAERRLSIQRILHKLYVFVSYGHRTGSYVPRYFKPNEIKTLADQTFVQDGYVYRDPALSFGAFISSFKFQGAEKF